MHRNLYITSNCIIRNNRVIRNGEPVEVQSSGELPEFLRALYDHFSGQYPKFHKMDLYSKLGWVATEILLQDMPLETYPQEDIAVVLSNRSGSLDTDERYFETMAEFASPALFVYTLPNIVIGEISIRHHLKGENAFFISEAFDIPMITRYVQQLLEDGQAEACICGWVEQYHEDYDAAVFLVEKTSRGMAQPFTKDNIEKLYQ